MNQPMNNHRLTLVILFFGIIRSCQFLTLYEMFFRFLRLITYKFVLLHLYNEKCMSMQRKRTLTLATFPCKKKKQAFTLMTVPCKEKKRVQLQ
jgi:hypothetical protein